MSYFLYRRKMELLLNMFHEVCIAYFSIVHDLGVWPIENIAFLEEHLQRDSDMSLNPQDVCVEQILCIPSQKGTKYENEVKCALNFFISSLFHLY